MRARARNRGLLAAVLSLGTGCLAEDCKKGQACEASCPSGESGFCVIKGVCRCAGGGRLDDGGNILPPGSEGGISPPAGCVAPLADELIINEVLVDPFGDEYHGEFVELVNTVDHPIDVSGLRVLQLKGAEQSEEIIFQAGCFPAFGAAAFYYKFNDPVTAIETSPYAEWSPQPEGGFAMTVKAYQFTNDEVIDLSLLDRLGVVISQFQGNDATVVQGTSLNRSTDGLTSAVGPHRGRVDGGSSPGACAEGGGFPNCMAGGQGGAGGTPSPGGMGGEPIVGGAGGASMGGMPMGGMPMGGTIVPPPVCTALEPNGLVINEVFGDGGDNEFIELVNAGAVDVDLTGFEITSPNGSGVQASRLIFGAGSIPARGVIVLYADVARWLSVPPGVVAPTRASGSFSIVDGQNIDVRLLDPSKALVSQFTVSPDAVIKTPDRFGNVSANRCTDLRGQEVVPHGAVGVPPSSPGTCADGSPFSSGCGVGISP